MAKPGAGKQKMKAERDRRWRYTQKRLNTLARIFKPVKRSRKKKKGCYIATCIYGSYDCPQVWLLRRYRDNYLDHKWWGRVFVNCYYVLSPHIVALFGQSKVMRKIWKIALDQKVEKLKAYGYKDTPYTDQKMY